MQDASSPSAAAVRRAAPLPTETSPSSESSPPLAPSPGRRDLTFDATSSPCIAMEFLRPWCTCFLIVLNLWLLYYTGFWICFLLIHTHPVFPHAYTFLPLLTSHRLPLHLYPCPACPVLPCLRALNVFKLPWNWLIEPNFSPLIFSKLRSALRCHMQVL